ncbi:unnamed protein product [Lupinus luteus]|uniref:Uncharacterized protein n=1 Tax=Lupinus luteus TaxID=3873 RepID=A0AAV1XAR1_LUPLU
MLGSEDKMSKLSATHSIEEKEPKNAELSKKSKLSNKKPGGWKAMPFILGNESFERLATFGLTANFMVYLIREFHLDQVSAANIIYIWSGVGNFAPVLGAFISDAYIGRFRTIAFGSFATLLGMILVTLTAWLPELHPETCTPQQLALNQCFAAPKTSQLGFLILGLSFLSIGTAGIRPCSIPFGVDQFDPTTDEGKKGVNSFFNWYYASFSLVLMFTSTVFVYIQDSVSWKIGFAIPTFCMFLSIILFFVGTRVYVYVKPEGSVFSGIAQVLVAAYKKRKLELPTVEKVDGVFYDPPLTGTVVLSKLPFTHQFSALNKAALIMEGEVNPDGSRANKWKLTSIQQVEEVKCLVRIIPIWAAGILSLTSMSQQGTFTVSQALRMDRHLGPNFQIPAGSVGVISLLTITLWVPFYDRVFVPTLRKITKHEGGITLLQRIGIGMVFSFLSMVVAGMVEKMRRNVALSNPTPLGITPMSVLWLTPQLFLMGLCEAFNIIGQIEFFNRQFPEHMRSIGNALFSCTFGFASYFNSMLVTTVQHSTGTKNHPNWLTKDINAGKLDYFYYLVAGIGVVNLIYFLYVSQKYQYKGSVVHQHKVLDVELGPQKPH